MGKNSRDVQIQFAVLIAPRANNTQMIGEKDKEILYDAIQYDASEIPVKLSDVHKSMEIFEVRIIQALRAHGFLRD